VYSREIDGMVLTLQASGWTFNNAFILYDHETGSLWWGGPGAAERELLCIEGYFRDRHLEKYPYLRSFWRNWIITAPESKIMVSK
jgi:hypothetical protein